MPISAVTTKLFNQAVNSVIKDKASNYVLTNVVAKYMPFNMHRDVCQK